MLTIRSLIVILNLFLFSCSDTLDDQASGLPCDPVNPDVPSTGDPALAWVTPVSGGVNVEQGIFCSGAAQTEVSYHIYKPDAYFTESGRRFPVMYWLHGGGQGPGIQGIPFLAQYFNSAINEGQIPPMLIVFPNSPVRNVDGKDIITMWVDSKDKKSPVETMVIRELIQHMDDTYRTIASREGRALDGFSMGGYGAARLGFKYNDLFCAISIQGAGPMQPKLVGTPRISEEARKALLQTIYGGSQDYFVAVSPRKMAQQNASQLKDNMHIRITVGETDETYDQNLEFHQYLDSLNIPHDFITAPDVPHNPVQLMNFLREQNVMFYQKVFEDL